MSTSFKKFLYFGLVLVMLLSACTAQPTPTTAPAQNDQGSQAQPTQPPADTAKKTLNVAVVVKAVTSDYWKAVGAGVEAAVKSDPTIKASFLGPNEETDIEGQIRILEAQIASKVDALAVAPSQADQVQPTLEKAVKAGIPVILIDTDIASFTGKTSFVGTDNKLGGKLGGEFIAKQLKSGDQVAIIRGAAGDPVHNLRETGAKEAMEAAGLKVVAIQPADSDRAKGQSVAENLLTANPDLKAIFATNDEMALGAFNAAKAAKKTLVVCGFDASPDALKSIAAGELSASIAQFAGKIGELGTQTAAKAARGEKVDAFVNTGVEVVSKDNVAKFMGGGDKPAATNKPLNIAVVVKAVTSDYWKAVGAGVDAAMKSDPSIKASFLGPNEETDIEGQIRILEAQIASKVDALAVAPSQADQVQPTLEKAVKAGIPVILIDTDIATFTNKASFVGTDNKLGGKLGGEFIAKQLKSGDQVAIIRGAAGDPVHNLRETGAKDAMEAAGLKVVAIQPADSDRAKGQSVAENLLIANPDLKAIFATNDEMALGAVNAAKSAKKTLVVCGFDASPDALKSIAAGELSASIAQFASKIGELGTLTAAKVARGEKADAFVNTGVEVVSKDNVAKFMGGGDKPAAKKPLNIAVVVKAVTSDYWKAVGAGVEAAMKSDPNIKASFLGPNEETDIEGQIRILEAQIASKVDALAVAPSQADQVQPTLEKAVKAGIPVILIDTDIATFTNKTSFVGTDNKLGGKLGGEFIAKQLKAGDQVAIIRGAAGDPVHNLREQGAKEALEAAGLKVVAIQPADSDRAKGQSVAENLLIANPDLKAIFATNDEMALGAVNAAKSAKKTLVVCGFDASPDALKSIAAGELAGSIAQFASKIGELGTLTAAKVAWGEKVDAFVNTGVEVVSKDNVAKFMK
jgi:ribose transport system substrate-binding protein